MSDPESKLPQTPPRLTSLDAYRGLVMLAMVSSGFAFANVVDKHPSVLTRYDGTKYAAAWEGLWRFLAYQFEHVAWTGCSFWDLIQPSFMFIVGVAMPFSYMKRQAAGEPWLRSFGHVLVRSLVLILLGVFLSSNWNAQTNFTFVNVLTQIGLGYAFVYLLLGRPFGVQLAAVVAILAGYWFYFFQYSIPETEMANVTRYLKEVRHKDDAEWNQFTGIASHWNKHTNAATAFDRRFLNLFPRHEEEWHGRRFWVNDGGYQTLNFIPSMATMILGLMAGQLLAGRRSGREKFQLLILSGMACFAIALALDTTIWPVQVAGWNWTVCPAVKRIWTPTWTVFSAGWAFSLLAVFYWVIDLQGRKAWAFPLVVVGMNSIAMYCMAQLLKPWVTKTLKTHLTTADAAFHTHIVPFFFSDDYAYAAIWRSLAVLAVLWLVCLWMYRRKLFIKI